MQIHWFGPAQVIVRSSGSRTWWLELRAHHSLEVERVGECARTYVCSGLLGAFSVCGPDHEIGGCGIESSLRCVSSGCCFVGGCHTHVKSRAASWDSSVGEEINRDPRHGVGFSGAAGFTVLKGSVQERSTQTALAMLVKLRLSSLL